MRSRPGHYSRYIVKAIPEGQLWTTKFKISVPLVNKQNTDSVTLYTVTRKAQHTELDSTTTQRPPLSITYQHCTTGATKLQGSQWRLEIEKRRAPEPHQSSADNTDVQRIAQSVPRSFSKRRRAFRTHLNGHWSACAHSVAMKSAHDLALHNIHATRWLISRRKYRLKIERADT